MTTTKPMQMQHGGKRPNAGRKPKPQAEKFVRVLITLPPDLAAALRKLPIGERSTRIAAAIRPYLFP